MLLSHHTFLMWRQCLGNCSCRERADARLQLLASPASRRDHGVLTGLNLRLPISRIALTISGSGSDALFNQATNGVRHDDFLAELLLLQQLQRAQRRAGMAAGGSAPHIAEEGGSADDVREVLCVLGLGEVLQVVQIRDKVRVVEIFLRGQVVQVPRVGQALDELRRVSVGAMRVAGICNRTSSSSSKRV